MKSFASILQSAPETLEPSTPLPAGEYIIQVIKAEVEELKFDFGDHPEGDENLMIYFKPVQAVEVEESDLEACEDWRNKLLNMRIFPEELGDRFCDVNASRGLVFDLGISPSDYENIGDLIAATVGQQCLGTTVHAPNKKNPDKPYVNLKATAPVE